MNSFLDPRLFVFGFLASWFFYLSSISWVPVSYATLLVGFVQTSIVIYYLREDFIDYKRQIPHLANRTPKE